MSKEFEKIFREDQKNTSEWEEKYTDDEYYELNRKLRKKVQKLIDEGKAKTGRDYFIAAIVFHHGFKIWTSRRAINYAKKAVDLGFEDKWIIASTIDRLLQLQKKPQRFGTQIIETKFGKVKMYEIDPKTTDEERKEYGLPTLKELKERLKN